MKNRAFGAVVMALALASCDGGRPDDGPGAPGGEGEEASLELRGFSPLAGTGWLVATVGADGKRRGIELSSKGYKEAIYNVALVDRATGETVSLLPDETRVIEQYYFARPQAGPLYGSADYREGSEDTAAPLYYLLETIVTTDEGKQHVLVAGSLEDFSSGPIATGFSDIAHAEMLDAQRVSIVLRNGKQHRLLVVNLATREVELEKKITPRPAG